MRVGVFIIDHEACIDWYVFAAFFDRDCIGMTADIVVRFIEGEIRIILEEMSTS